MTQNNRRMGRAALAIAALMTVAAIFLPQNIGLTPRGIAFAEDTATAGMLDSPFKAVHSSVSPSVVGIEIMTSTSMLGGRISQSTSYVGSGVAISDDGYVVTNYHVIEGAEAIYVVSGDTSYPAEYIAGDQATDVAVLKIESGKIPTAKVGDSDALSVGDWALVIGNPLGAQFANTLTVGVISGLGRDMTETGRNSGAAGATNMIQTNAAINAGNSGGGLFNIQGELVGITSMKLSNNGYYGYASIEGIGFAIPVNSVKTIVNDLLQYGKVRYPRVGIATNDLATPSMEPSKDMLPRSVLVTKVQAGSPAAAAGMKVDDLILEVDGIRVTTGEEVSAAVRKHSAGETVSFKVYRIPGLSELTVDQTIPDGEYLTLTMTVTMEE